MILNFFHTTVYAPLYNALIFIVEKVPGHDVGIAVILLTILVRFLLYPLSKRMINSQLAMKKIAPEVEALKRQYKNDLAAQNKAIFALYKERDIHPFAGMGMMLIQLPILFSLYYIFAQGGLPKVETAILYSFVSAPETVNMLFLGVIDMAAAHNIPLAILVALTQAFYTRLSMGKTQKDSPVEASLSSDLAKSFDFQARYVMPLMIGVIAYIVPSAASLYLVTANVVMVAQEFIAGRRL